MAIKSRRRSAMTILGGTIGIIIQTITFQMQLEAESWRIAAQASFSAAPQSSSYAVPQASSSLLRQSAGADATAGADGTAAPAAVGASGADTMRTLRHQPYQIS